MPEKVLNQIKWLCREIPKVEWSGVLFYSLEGSIKDPENMVLTLEGILPMQKGTATFTEYSFDERVVEYMMDNEGAEDWKLGHIHSHNTMAVYFSGTDWSELEDNAPNHNFYLSLIVNNFMDFCAKVCFIAEGKSENVQFVAKDENGEKYTYASTEETVEKEKLVVYDCEIDAPNNAITVSEDFSNQVAGIIKTAETKAKTTTYTGSNVAYTGYGRSRITPANTSNNYGQTWQQKQSNHNPGVNAWGGEWQGFVEEEEDLMEDAVEEFTKFALNTGNDVSKLKDLEDVLDIYKAYNLAPNALAKGVLEKYTIVYNKFFDTSTDKDSPEMFIEVTKGVIDNIDTEIWTSQSKYVIKMLKPVKHSLENMLAKFVKQEQV